MRKFFTPLTGLAALLVICISYVGKTDAQTAQSYKVRRIIDADTYEMTAKDNKGKYIQIRLACADSGEIRRNNTKSEAANKSQLYWGNMAKTRTTQLISQSSNTIRFTPNGSNSHNRKVGDVRLADGTLIQETLAREGLVMLDRRYKNCNAAEEKAESYAKTRKLKIWDDPSFMAPWEFRKR
jgi:micrococcal nuclease